MMLYFAISLTDSLLALFCPVMIWAVLLSFFLALFFAIDDGIKRLWRLHQIPCDRCRYYTGSQYLRCPVNPLAVFSEEAIHCGDFEPACQRRPQRPKRLTKQWRLTRYR